MVESNLEIRFAIYFIDIYVYRDPHNMFLISKYINLKFHKASN